MSKGHLVTAALALILSAPITALEVIYDSGQTVPVGQYFKRIQQFEAGAKAALEGSKGTVIDNVIAEPVMLERHFPLTTTLQPGAPVEIDVGLVSPLFVIGLDDQSLIWVESNLEQLRRYRGIVVSGRYDVFLKVRDVLADQGIPLDIAPGDAIAQEYGLSTYPALIQ